MCWPSASASAAPGSAGASPCRTASSPELPRLYGLFARLERPIPFEAIDDQPVDLVFVLLAPGMPGPSTCGRWPASRACCATSAICQKLRGTDNADALYALLTDRTDSHAA